MRTGEACAGDFRLSALLQCYADEFDDDPRCDRNRAAERFGGGEQHHCAERDEQRGKQSSGFHGQTILKAKCRHLTKVKSPRLTRVVIRRQEREPGCRK